jgi:tryptophanyl-tRNA synthetase
MANIVVHPDKEISVGPIPIDGESKSTDMKSTTFSYDTFDDTFETYLRKNYPEILEMVEAGLLVHHRSLFELLKEKDKGKEIYIYTGRGPSSSSLHFGHYLPFYITKKLQDILKCKVVIQITDDEKYIYDRDNVLELSEYQEMAEENIKDIIAFGFSKKDTFIFRNTKFIDKMYEYDLRLKKRFTNNQIINSFGVDMSDNCGRVSYPTLQMVPCIPKVFEPFISSDALCLIPCADDQDVYFRLVRDVLEKMGYKKPSLVYVGYVPSLQGMDNKMSSSKPETAIFLSDGNKVIKKKISRAFSGGKETIEEHREKGGNCKVDVPLNILKYFIPKEEFKDICKSYSSGELLSGELKKKVSTKLIDLKDKFISNRHDTIDSDYLSLVKRDDEIWKDLYL